jgi:hypothetical protein
MAQVQEINRLALLRALVPSHFSVSTWNNKLRHSVIYRDRTSPFVKVLA